MRLESVNAKNFCSYEELHIDLNNRGLTLLHGATGGGKSTLCDVIAWGLFGVTAKNGAVDEVLKWSSDSITEVTTMVTTDDVSWYIVRTRGKKAKDNDLYFIKNCTDERAIRGKDLNDTQKLINNRLGISAEIFLSGSYFHEFSQAAQFFITTAKNRRTILEQVVDLSFAKNLQQKTSDRLKLRNTALYELNLTLQGTERDKQYAQQQHDKAYDNFIGWSAKHIEKVDALKVKRDNFEKNKLDKKAILDSKILNLGLQAESLGFTIETLQITIRELEGHLTDDVCSECGAFKDNKEHNKHAAMKADLSKNINTKTYVLKELIATETELANLELYENTYQEQIDSASKMDNPYKKILADMQDELYRLGNKLFTIKAEAEIQSAKVQKLDILLGVLNDLRAHIVKSTISNIETKTNKYLNDHFDAEIRISLTIVDADKVEVEVSKDGNTCSYSQLSKGQRQLLKLCFGITVMQAISNQHGVDFNTAMIDEALDGLSEQFKIKAYGLLQELALQYENVFVVEHSSELKNLFENKIMVELINGSSVLHEQA